MNDKGDTRGDLRLPEGELGEKIREDFDKDISLMVSCPFIPCCSCLTLLLVSSFQLTVLGAVGEECIIASKTVQT